MAKTKITSKGQVTIPEDVRERLGLRPGHEIEFVEDRSGFRVRKRVPASPSRSTGATSRSWPGVTRTSSSSRCAVDDHARRYQRPPRRAHPRCSCQCTLPTGRTWTASSRTPASDCSRRVPRRCAGQGGRSNYVRRRPALACPQCGATQDLHCDRCGGQRSAEAARGRRLPHRGARPRPRRWAAHRGQGLLRHVLPRAEAGVSHEAH